MVVIKDGRKDLRERALIDHFSTLGFPAGRLEKITGHNEPSPGNFWIFGEFS
jgi:hypothetical protein